jgi:hypothetical protein
MKILIMVLCECKGEGYYAKMEDAIRETWAKDALSSDNVVDLLYLYGQWDRDIIGDYQRMGDKLHLNHPESYFGTSGKNVLSLCHASEEYEFDYLLRVNLSSYIHLNNLISFLSDQPKSNFYCGATGKHPDNPDIEFVSGSAFILSKDLVDLVAQHRGEINFNTIDDIALGKFLHDHKISITKGKRYWIHSAHSDGPIGIDDDSHYHYRVHTTEGSPEPHIRRMDDANKIQSIHNYFNHE